MALNRFSGWSWVGVYSLTSSVTTFWLFFWLYLKSKHIDDLIIAEMLKCPNSCSLSYRDYLSTKINTYGELWHHLWHVTWIICKTLIMPMHRSHPPVYIRDDHSALLPLLIPCITVHVASNCWQLYHIFYLFSVCYLTDFCCCSHQCETSVP